MIEGNQIDMRRNPLMYSPKLYTPATAAEAPDLDLFCTSAGSAAAIHTDCSEDYHNIVVAAYG